MLTLMSLHAQSGFMEDHPGAMEAHAGLVEVYLGAVEPHPVALEAHPGALKAHPLGPWRLILGLWKYSKVREIKTIFEYNFDFREIPKVTFVNTLHGPQPRPW
jgi:hypothetical protein